MRITSGLTRQDPPSISLTLHFQVWQKIQVLAHNLGIVAPTVKILALINQLILAYSFVLQNNIIGIEEDQVNVTKADARQIGENVQFSGKNPWVTRHDRQIQVAFGVSAA